MSMSVRMALIWSGLLLACPSQSAAQGFGGSFDSEPSPTVNQAAQPTTTGGGFGGSFETDSPTDQSDNASAGTPTSGSGGGFGFDEGSFATVPPEAPSEAAQTTPEAPAGEQVAPERDIVLDPQIFAFESRDFGVAPSSMLRNGQMHGATPTAIPGAALISTEALANALNAGIEVVLIDVLGGEYTLPGAFGAPGLAASGTFQDRTQQQATLWLNQITEGDRDAPIVIFCSNPQCWLSYNATLRTVNAGFGAVYWYRGGLQAWQMAGLPLQPSAY